MNHPFNIGLKLHSTNTDLIPEALSLWKKDLFQYIELYIIPGSYPCTHEIWRRCHIPFVLHAAHSYDGINLASRTHHEKNHVLFQEVQQFADVMDASTIIVHGGMEGSIEETIYQVSRLEDPRIVLENKPRVAIRGEACVGATPQEFQKVAQAGVLKGFVLDFGHAECAAVSMGLKPIQLIKEFLTFEPNLYHLSDGDSANERDTHSNFGKGDRNLAAFVQLVPVGACVTIETPRNPLKGLGDFVCDVHSLAALFSSEQYFCSTSRTDTALLWK